MMFRPKCLNICAGSGILLLLHINNEVAGWVEALRQSITCCYVVLYGSSLIIARGLIQLRKITYQIAQSGFSFKIIDNIPAGMGFFQLFRY